MSLAQSSAFPFTPSACSPPLLLSAASFSSADAAGAAAAVSMLSRAFTCDCKLLTICEHRSDASPTKSRCSFSGVSEASSKNLPLSGVASDANGAPHHPAAIALLFLRENPFWPPSVISSNDVMASNPCRRRRDRSRCNCSTSAISSTTTEDSSIANAATVFANFSSAVTFRIGSLAFNQLSFRRSTSGSMSSPHVIALTSRCGREGLPLPPPTVPTVALSPIAGANAAPSAVPSPSPSPSASGTNGTLIPTTDGKSGEIAVPITTGGSSRMASFAAWTLVSRKCSRFRIPSKKASWSPRCRRSWNSLLCVVMVWTKMVASSFGGSAGSPLAAQSSATSDAPRCLIMVPMSSLIVSANDACDFPALKSMLTRFA